MKVFAVLAVIFAFAMVAWAQSTTTPHGSPSTRPHGSATTAPHGGATTKP